MSIGANLISIVEIRPERQKAVSKLQRGSERPLWMYDRNHWFYARCGNLSTISMSSKAFTSLIWYSFRWMCRTSRTKGFPGVLVALCVSDRL